jgi:hypothetical protein
MTRTDDAPDAAGPVREYRLYLGSSCVCQHGGEREYYEEI